MRDWITVMLLRRKADVIEHEILVPQCHVGYAQTGLAQVKHNRTHAVI